MRRKKLLNIGLLQITKEDRMKKTIALLVIGCLLLFYSFNIVLGQAPKPPKKTPELLAQGKRVYEQNCSPCHGTKGDGKGPAGVVLKPPPNDFNNPLKEWPKTKGDPNKIFEVITKGVPNSAMVKWDNLSEKERWALVYTVLGFAAPKVPPKKK
jgi:mono/diheme cytochrome c family protein